MDNSTEPILMELNKLKETQNAIHLDPIDILWDIPNQLVNSIETLLIILTKTSLISFIPDYNEENIYTSLGINSEQAKIIQEQNKNLIQLHIYTIKYIVQQYTLMSYIKKMMDNIILEIPETDTGDLLSFINNYNSQSQGQKGGNNLTNKLIPILFAIICLIQIAIPSVAADNSLQLISSDKTEQFQKGIISFPESQFIDKLFEKKEITSGPVNMNNLVVRYDQQITEQTSGLIGQLLSIITSPEADGQTVLKNIIETFNVESRKISSSAEKSCIDLMIIAKDKGIFQEWRDMDSLQDTTDKLKNINNEVINQNNELKTDVINTVGTLFTGIVSNDYTLPIMYLADLGGNFVDYIKSTNSLNQESKEILEEQPSYKLTKTEKMELEAKMFTFSKIYCSFGYNLQLDLQGTNVAVIGDKIDYLWMIELIDNLKTNIEFQITRITAEVNTNVNANVDLNQNQQSNLITINILESIHQRFDVLKAITDSLYNIVNFSFKIEMLKLSRFSSPTNMEQFKTFLDNQLASLNIMLSNLNTQFPKKQAELQLQKKQTEEEIEIEAFEQDIENLRQNATDIARQRSAEMTTRHNNNWWISVETVAQSWVNIGLNGTEFTRKNVGLAVASLSNIGLEIPYAVFSSILQYLDKVLIELLFSPLGFVLIIGGLLSTVFMFGGISGTIRIFKKGGEFFVAVFWGGILFIYKLIKTPFGYIFKQMAVKAEVKR